MGIILDIICHTICVGGSYVFGLVPASYAVNVSKEVLAKPKEDEAKKGSDKSDIAKRLLRKAYEEKANAFGCVPWVLKEFMDFEIALRGAEHEDSRWIRDTLKDFKIVLAGGAATEPAIIEWAEEIGLNLALGIGMTEIAGAS